MDQVRVLFSVGDLLTRKTVSQVIFVFTLTAFTLPSTHAIQCFECDSSKVSSAGKFISSLHTKHFIEFFLHWILGPELKCGPRSGIWLYPCVRGELNWGCYSNFNNIYLQAQYCIKMTGIFEGKLGTKRFCSSRDWGHYCEYIKRPGDIQVCYYE